jgi:uncharacterized protein YecT (DUF1311 family)
VRRSTLRLLVHSLALGVFASSGGALAAQNTAPPVGEAAAPQDICPAIDEGFRLCSSDLWSGNCAQFVAAAGRLAELYQIQVDETPERVPMLLSTNWWGCGDAPLTQMKELLLRIDTPAAQQVLQQEPYSRLAPSSAAGAPQAPAPTLEPDCVGEPTPAAQDACASGALAAAQGAYRRALATCSAGVAPELRNELEGSEQAWQQLLPAQCDDATSEYDEPRLQAFARSQCLARATRERTRGMLAAHPECRPAP